MRAMLGLCLSALLATPVAAEEWRYEGGGTPIAYVDNGAAQFQFACRGGDLAMGYWVRAPHKEVAKAGAMNLSITPDGSGTSFAQELPLIHADGSSVIVRGPVARQWARIARQAKDSLRVAYVRTAGQTLDSNDFGASGSSAAIAKVLDRCG